MPGMKPVPLFQTSNGDEDSDSDSDSGSSGFDSEDDRVNQIPGSSKTAPSTAQVSSVEASSSSSESGSESEYESASESEEKPAQPNRQSGAKRDTPASAKSSPAPASKPVAGPNSRLDAGRDSGSESQAISESDEEPVVKKSTPAPGLKHTTTNGRVVAPAKKVPSGTPSDHKAAKPKLQKVEVAAPKVEAAPKKGKVETSKRERDDEVDVRASVKKRKKDAAENANKSIAQPLTSPRGREKPSLAESGKKKGDTEKVAPFSDHDRHKEIARKSLMDNQAQSAGKNVKGSNKPDKATKHVESDTAASPQKAKKPSHMWTPAEEIMLSNEVLNHVRSGGDIPNKKSDEFWDKLCNRPNGKLEISYSKDQLFEKIRRMRTRYNTMAERAKDIQKPFKHRNDNDQMLFNIWSQIWGKAEVVSMDEEKVEDGKESPKQITATTPVKEAKLASNKKDSDAGKAKQSRKGTTEPEASSSEEESDDKGVLVGNETTVMPTEVEKKDAPKALAEGNENGSKVLSTDLLKIDVTNGKEDGKVSHVYSDMQRALQDVIQPSVSQLQQKVEDLTKVVAVLDNSVKTMGHLKRMSVGAVHSPHFKTGDLFDYEFAHEDQGIQQQWYELQLQEIDVYSQKLQLLQRECELKRQRVKLQAERGH